MAVQHTQSHFWSEFNARYHLFSARLEMVTGILWKFLPVPFVFSHICHDIILRSATESLTKCKETVILREFFETIL